MNSKDYEELKAMMKIAQSILDTEESSSSESKMEAAADELNAYAAENNYASFHAVVTDEGTIIAEFDDEDTFMELLEIDSDTIEDTKKAMDNLCRSTSTETSEKSSDYCIDCHNIKLIDGIINNTLSAKKDITNSMADVLIKLKKLQKMIREGYDAD